MPETTERTEYRVVGFREGKAAWMGRGEVGRRNAERVVAGTPWARGIQYRTGGGPWVDLDEGEEKS